MGPASEVDMPMAEDKARTLATLADKPISSVEQAHKELGVEIEQAHMLVNAIAKKITPVLNTRNVEEDRAKDDAIRSYSTPLAAHVQGHTFSMKDLNRNLEALLKAIDL